MVSIGLQESVVTSLKLVLLLTKGLEWGTLVYIPLLIMVIWGMIKRKFLGLFAMAGVMAMTDSLLVSSHFRKEPRI
ncbi:MAG: hypothetical protein KAS13_05000 [Candidatus Omnitrophica bacterium]|nr:hypothetical protein [Candidatus Omnitrophota bacterium]